MTKISFSANATNYQELVRINYDLSLIQMGDVVAEYVEKLAKELQVTEAVVVERAIIKFHKDYYAELKTKNESDEDDEYYYDDDDYESGDNYPDWVEDRFGDNIPEWATERWG